MHHKILIIEDHAKFASVLKKLLERTYDCTCICVTDLRDAVDKIGDNGFTAVVCDADLPQSGARETCARAPKIFGPRPVVMMSSIHDSELIDIALDAGAATFIVKDATSQVAIAEAVGLTIRKRVQDADISRAALKIRTSRSVRLGESLRKNWVGALALLLSILVAGTNAGAVVWKHQTGEIKNAEDISHVLKEHDKKLDGIDIWRAHLEEKWGQQFSEFTRKQDQQVVSIADLVSKAEVSISERRANRDAITETKREMNERFDSQDKKLFEILRAVKN